MKKLWLLLFLCICTYSNLFSQIGNKPTTFDKGINVPNILSGNDSDSIALYRGGILYKTEFTVNDLDREVKSVARLKTITNVDRGKFVKTLSYYDGLNLGGAIYKKVDPSGLTANDMDIIIAEDGDMYQLSVEIVTPYMFGALDNDITHTSKIQAFFDYVDTEDLVGDFRGVWEIDDTITITGSSQKFICGSFETLNNALVEPAVSIETSNSLFTGELNITGSTAASYSNRNSLTGLDFTNGGGRNSFDYIRVTGFKGYGIRLFGTAGGNNTMTIIDRIKLTACGSTGSTYLTGSATAIVSAVVSSGSTGSVNQRSTLTVDSVDSAWVESELLEINGEIHYITAVNGNDIEVYPWVDTSFTGTIYGLNGGFLIAGADGASLNIQQIDAIRCGSIRTGSLYGSIIDVIQTQSCGIGYAIGYVYNSNNLGSVVNQLYTENNVFDLAQITGVNTNTKVNMVTEQIDKFFIMQPQNTLFEDQNNTGFPGILNRNSQTYSPTILQKKRNLISTATTVRMSNDKIGNEVSLINDSPTFEIRWDDAINNAFGLDQIFINLYGTGANNNPTGNVTFNLDSDDQTAGITIMSSTSYVLSGLTEPAFIKLIFDHANQNWLVSNSSGLPDTTSNWEIINPNGGTLVVNRDNGQVTDGQEVGGIDFKTEDPSFADGDEVVSRLLVLADGALGTGSNSKADLVYQARQLETQSYTEQLRIKSNGDLIVNKYRLSALNTAPSSSTDTGILGEIRIDGSFIYVCTATDTWVRASLTTW